MHAPGGRDEYSLAWEEKPTPCRRSTSHLEFSKGLGDLVVLGFFNSC